MNSPVDLSHSLVVAPICKCPDLDLLAEIQIADQCDVIELRLDCLKDYLDQTASLLTNNRPTIPIIATARHPDEGGCHSLDTAARLELFLRFLEQVDAIDIELRSIDEMSEAVNMARSAGKTVILSFHDFESTPSIATIQSKIDQAVDAGADACKIAVYLDSLSDLCELTQVCESESRIKLSMMGMGPLGKLSRLVFAKAGSALNYGYLKESNAPGQWAAAELQRLIREI